MLMKKILLLNVLLFFISCNNLENCEIEIVDNLVYKNEVLYTGKCAFYDDNNGKMISSHDILRENFMEHGNFIFQMVN